MYVTKRKHLHKTKYFVQQIAQEKLFLFILHEIVQIL